MKRLLIIGLALIACAGILVSSARAQDMTPQTESTVLDNLVSRCDDIQGSLRRLHTNDALLRVNIGQTYNTISARLMARLNSRLALNRIDSRELVEVAGGFDQQRSDFSVRYNSYESALSELVKIDCRTKSAEFYAQLIATRDLRLALSETVVQMNTSVVDYRTAVERLKAHIEGGENAGEV